MPLIAQRVSYSYGQRQVLTDVSLRLDEGTIVSLLGPNGAGKTTLISLLVGLRSPSSGQVSVLVGGRSHPPAGRVSWVPQRIGIYPTLSVRENLSYAAALAGLRGRGRAAAVAGMAEKLGLEALLTATAGRISGGEQRRVHLGMGIMGRPSSALLDEPTVGADIESRAQILAMVRDLARDGTAICYTTHTISEVEELGGRIAILLGGVIRAEGSREDLATRYGMSVIELETAGIVDGAQVRTKRQISTSTPDKTLGTLIGETVGAGLTVEQVRVYQPGVASLYERIVHGNSADEVASAVPTCPAGDD